LISPKGNKYRHQLRTSLSSQPQVNLDLEVHQDYKDLLVNLVLKENKVEMVSTVWTVSKASLETF